MDFAFSTEQAELQQRGIKLLPRTLHEAVSCLQDDEVVLDALGSVYGDYYAQIKEEEWRQYHNTVSEWESEQYLGLF